MATMDAFKSDAFSTTSLMEAVERIGYTPQFLGSIPGLFVPKPVRTKAVWIEERENAPALIQTDLRGNPPARKTPDKRKARAFSTVRVALADRIEAASIQEIRAFGSETELMSVQAEIARRMAPLRNDIELTLENMRLGAIQGLVTDADGSTLWDWATEFGQTIPTEINFDLDNASPASGVVRKKCNDVVRTITKNLKGLGGGAVKIYGLCGDAFWDDLTAHKEIRETYLNTQAASDLRSGNTYGTFTYGGITFINYRGSDDGVVGINTDKVKFFPVGAGIFQIAFSPGESLDWVNTLGREVYAMTVPDRDRNMWVDLELYSYPLPVCTMPQALHRGKRT